MKKIIALILAIAIVMMTGVVAFAERPVKLYIGGEPYFLEKTRFGDFCFYRDTIPTDVSPKIVNGRTMLPVRVVFEAIGAKVGWDDATQTVTATKGDAVVTLQIGSNVMTVNGTEKIIDVPAYVENGRTMVPVRACAEAFNLAVEWDEETYTVKVRKEFQVPSEVYGSDGKLQEKYTYDDNGNMVSYEPISGLWERNTYNDKGMLVRRESYNELFDSVSVYEIVYDERGNPVKFGGSGTNTYYCTYDENDNLIYKENEAKNWTKYEYITNEGDVEKILYEKHTGETGYYQVFFGPEYTEFCAGRYWQGVHEGSTRTYDRSRWLISDAYNGDVSTYTNEYDENGKLLGHYMDGTTTWGKYEYDANGNLIRETKSWGEDTIYEYDEYNKLVKKTYSQRAYTNEITTYEYYYDYDENGKLIKSTSNNGSVTTYITVVR